MKQNLNYNVLVLADRANGRAIFDCVASVCRLWRYVLWLTVRSKFTIDSLYIIYEKSIGTKMNDIDLCLEVV